MLGTGSVRCCGLLLLAAVVWKDEGVPQGWRDYGFCRELAQAARQDEKMCYALAKAKFRQVYPGLEWPACATKNVRALNC